MRTALLADIHSNLEALDAVVARARILGVDRFWVLGDMVGYGADPQGAVDRLADLDAFMIAGNHDLAAAGAFDPRWFNPAARAATAWTSTRLSASHGEMLRRLPTSLAVDDVLLVHASVRDPVSEYLTDVTAAAASFEATAVNLCFFGHTHIPRVFSLLGETVRDRPLDDGEETRLRDGERLLFNPGSVGQPRDGDPRASFAVFDGESIVLHRVEYDVLTTQQKIVDAGLPSALARRLALGM